MDQRRIVKEALMPGKTDGLEYQFSQKIEV